MKELDKQELSHIRHEFSLLFHLAEPYNECVFYSAIGQRGIVEWEVRGGEQPIDQIIAEIQNAGEDPNEWSLLALLKKPLPEGFIIPDEFKGIRTYVTIKDRD